MSKNSLKATISSKRNEQARTTAIEFTWETVSVTIDDSVLKEKNVYQKQNLSKWENFPSIIPV